MLLPITYSKKTLAVNWPCAEKKSKNAIAKTGKLLDMEERQREASHGQPIKELKSEMDIL